ncbi:MAG TPA: FAD-dependent oxidoreductase, partial [Gemmatimonadales bacterium]|nr:FAD-dependent oxidoreductase [Gemmatimonadales bacterium]
AGMLAPQIDAPEDDVLFELGLAGREYYRDVAAPLLESTQIDIGLWEGGILQIATSEAQVETLKQRVASQRQHGHHCEWLDPDEVRRDWPWLAPTQGGLFAPRDGCLDPIRLVEALRKDAIREGAEVVADTIHTLTHSGGRVTGVEGAEWHPADQVVLAAGAWSGRIANLPRPVSVEPVRGQLVAYRWPAQAEPSIVFGHGGYLLHRAGEGITGTTVEHAGFSAQVTEAGLASIRERAALLTPALADAKVLRAWAGLRPGTPDGLPIVGKEPTLQGLWYATGHGRNGILLAGITGTIINHLLSGESTVDEIEAMRPGRFWSW